MTQLACSRSAFEVQKKKRANSLEGGGAGRGAVRACARRSPGKGGLRSGAARRAPPAAAVPGV